MEREKTMHPRPQMARACWIDLCGPWGFAYDDRNCGLEEHWEALDSAQAADVFTRSITVPFPPESPASGIADPSFHPVVWYRRTFDFSPEGDGRRLILHCGAVDYCAQVWVNGQSVAEHQGGNTPFRADITAALRPEGEQVIVIRAEDAPRDLAQPRGKQDWRERPHAIWYQRTTGVWQPVWLEPVNETHLRSIRWTPDPDRGQLGLHLTLASGGHATVRVGVQLRLHGVSLADDEYTVHPAGEPVAELQRVLALDPHALQMDRERILWAPEHPNLVEATLSVLVDGRAVDIVHTYVGLRTVGTAHRRFLLNGRPYYLRLALEQGYWPQSHLAAPSEQTLRREVELVKELGFNGVRIHQKVEDPRFLYWCDRLGLLVWGEMANAYVFSTQTVERFTHEWLEVLARDYSHPCIVTWVPINESWGVPNLVLDPAQQHFVHAMYHLTRSIDPTRPVVANDGWEHLCGDLIGIHDYTFSGETLRERYHSTEAVASTMRQVQPGRRFVTLQPHRDQDEPIILSEFGGLSFRPEAGERWHGYGTVPDREAFVQKYRELLDAVLDSPAISGFCYTQLTDTAQETNGLLTESREPKVDPAVIRAITSRPSAAVPADLITQLQKAAAPPLAGSSLPQPEA